MSRYRKKTIKSRFDKAMLATTLLCLLPMVIGLALYVQLPESIATHFNLRNEADGFSSKNFAVFGLPQDAPLRGHGGQGVAGGLFWFINFNDTSIDFF